MLELGARTAIRSSIVAMVILATSQLLGAQGLTYVPRDESTPPPASFITINPPKVCTVRQWSPTLGDFVHQTVDAELTDETFIKTFAGTSVNVTANITGACDWYISGQFYWTQTRYLTKVFFQAYAPGNSTPDTSYFFPNNYTQSMDTRVSGTTSGPLYWSATLPGRHRLDFQTQAYPTNCMIQQYSPIVGTHINAMQCRPEWLLHPSGANLHVGPGAVTINLAPEYATLRPILDLVKADFENALGITITVTTDSGCSASDPRCVNIVDNYGTLPNDKSYACAGFEMGNAQAGTGVYLDPAVIRLRSVSLWTNAHPNNLRSTVAHEVAHYFGLEEREHSSCSTADTIMTPGPCYSPIPATSPTGPTASDIEALVRSTRGNNNRKVCGW